MSNEGYTTRKECKDYVPSWIFTFYTGPSSRPKVLTAYIYEHILKIFWGKKKTEEVLSEVLLIQHNFKT